MPAGDIIAYDTNQAGLNEKAAKIGFIPAKSLEELCRLANRVVLSVKPNVIPLVMREAKDALAGKAVVSIAAEYLQNCLAKGFPIRGCFG